MTSLTTQEKVLRLTNPNRRLFLQNMKIMGEERDIPNISWDTASFLIDTLQSRDISQILEIGPANGFSTMMLSLACPTAHITSIEFSRHAFEELRHNIQIFNKMTNDEGQMMNEGGFSPADFPPKVTSPFFQEEIEQFSLYYGDARELLPAFLTGKGEVELPHPKSLIKNVPKRSFDCIFIDGAFRMTREFFDLSRPLLTPGGLIILDDAIKYRWKMEGFHEYLEEQGIQYQLVQTDPDDGVMVIESESA